MNTTSSESVQSLSPSKPKINWKHEFGQYGMALAIAAPFYAALSFYLFFRRGYYDLYIANKAFAGLAGILLGIVLLLGPCSRMFSFPDRYVQYRKELGIIAFFLALIHSLVSLFFLPSKFPLSRYFAAFNWPFVFGLAAIIILIMIFAISNNRTMAAIGRARWWRLQYWGVRVVFTLVILHALNYETPQIPLNLLYFKRHLEVSFKELF